MLKNPVLRPVKKAPDARLRRELSRAAAYFKHYIGRRPFLSTPSCFVFHDSVVSDICLFNASLASFFVWSYWSLIKRGLSLRTPFQYAIASKKRRFGIACTCCELYTFARWSRLVLSTSENAKQVLH